MFRVAVGPSRNLINRRLDPGKVRKFHVNEGIAHFFF